MVAYNREQIPDKELSTDFAFFLTYVPQFYKSIINNEKEKYHRKSLIFRASVTFFPPA